MTKASRATVRVTPAILGWAAADLVGVLMLVAGAAYLVYGSGPFGLRVPSSTTEAALAIVLGLGVVGVAAVKMLAEVFRQFPRDGTARRARDRA